MNKPQTRQCLALVRGKRAARGNDAINILGAVGIFPMGDIILTGEKDTGSRPGTARKTSHQDSTSAASMVCSRARGATLRGESVPAAITTCHSFMSSYTIGVFENAP